MGTSVVCFLSLVTVLSFFFKVTISVSTSATSPSVFQAEPSNATLVFEHGDTSTTKSVEFTCAVESLQNNQKVSWIKHGKGVISDNESVRSTVVDEFRYIIKTEQFTSAGTVWNSFNLFIYQTTSTHAQIDGGEYKCALLEEGNDSTVIAESRTAVLEIYVIPRISHPLCFLNGTESSSLTDIKLVEHQIVILSCRADPGIPYVNLTWHRKNMILSDTRYGLLRGENIFYDDFDWTVLRNDTGLWFMCQLQHPGLLVGNHSRTNASCTIGPFDILFKPDVEITPSHFVINNVNDTLTLVCNGSGNPPVERINWFFDGKLVNENVEKRFTLSNDTTAITLMGFKLTDRGQHKISCTAENGVGIGIATSIFEVVITFPGISDSTTSITTTHSRETMPNNDHGSPGEFTKSTLFIVIILIGVFALFIVILIIVIVCSLKARRKPMITENSELGELKKKKNDYGVQGRSETENNGNAFGNSNPVFSEIIGRTEGDGLEVSAPSRYQNVGDITAGANDKSFDIHQENGETSSSQQISDTTKIAGMYASHNAVTNAENNHQQAQKEKQKPSEYEELKTGKRSNDDLLGNTSAADIGKVTDEENDTQNESFVSHPIEAQSETNTTKKTSDELHYADLDLTTGGRKQPQIRKKEEPVIYAQIQKFTANKSNLKKSALND